MAGELHFWYFNWDCEVIPARVQAQGDLRCGSCQENFMMEFDVQENVMLGGDDSWEDPAAFKELDGERPDNNAGRPIGMVGVLALKQVVLLDGADKICTVCLEHFQDGGKVIELPCRHDFHEGCILSWLPWDASCPMCRERLPTAPKDF